MYQEDKHFKTPDDKQKIWRYMDFTKFLDILDKSELFFPSIEQLGDPFEGSYPKPNITFRKENPEVFFKKELLDDKYKVDYEKILKNFTRLWRSLFVVSCWNNSEHDSAALWQLYSSDSEGIAIQTTIERLKRSLKEEEQDISIGEVKYLDFQKESIPEEDYYYPFLYKRKSFEHEKEIRAVILPRPVKIGRNLLKVGRKEGYYANINPDLLIERVYVSPLSLKWKRELVESVLSKYGLRKKVRQSNLHGKPLF